MKLNRVLLTIAIITLLYSATANATCNSRYVRWSHKTITVLPTGSDDTANLQCAFDLGATIPGVTLQLSKGTFITGRLVVDGFNGTVRGMGMNVTTIRNPDTPLYVTPGDFYMVPPNSPYFAPPYLLVFLGGDYNVTDLGLSIVGGNPATDWSIFGIRDWLGHGITSLAGPLVILGSATDNGYRKANASFQRVAVKGELSDDPLYGYNTYNGIFYEGFVGPELLPIKGTFKVTDSAFQTVGSSTPVDNLVDSRVSLTGNKLSDVVVGGEILDLKNTVYEFAHNQVTGYYGIDLYDNCIGSESNCGTSASYLSITNNIFRGTEGVWLDATFAKGTAALVLGNNFSLVNDIAVYLGERTSHCLVVGVDDGTVVDKGTDNFVIGMRKAGRTVPARQATGGRPARRLAK